VSRAGLRVQATTHFIAARPVAGFGRHERIDIAPAKKLISLPRLQRAVGLPWIDDPELKRPSNWRYVSPPMVGPMFDDLLRRADRWPTAGRAAVCLAGLDHHHGVNLGMRWGPWRAFVGYFCWLLVGR
jgi:hypothetical protein